MLTPSDRVWTTASMPYPDYSSELRMVVAPVLLEIDLAPRFDGRRIVTCGSRETTRSSMRPFSKGNTTRSQSELLGALDRLQVLKWKLDGFPHQQRTRPAWLSLLPDVREWQYRLSGFCIWRSLRLIDRSIFGCAWLRA